MPLIYRIGIDPGTETGFAVFSTRRKELAVVDTGTMTEAQQWVLNNLRVCQINGGGDTLELVIEDCRHLRLPRHLQRGGHAAMQGVGSVKRDVKLWIEFCGHHSIPYRLIQPSSRVPRKLSAAQFQQMTGWTARTSSHARDAACLVYESSPIKATVRP